MKTIIFNHDTQPDDRFFCSQVGLIYVFNVIVGTGALTMPGAFVAAGWLLGLVFVLVLAFMRSVTNMTSVYFVTQRALKMPIINISKRFVEFEVYDNCRIQHVTDSIATRKSIYLGQRVNLVSFNMEVLPCF